MKICERCGAVFIEEFNYGEEESLCPLCREEYKWELEEERDRTTEAK